MGRLATPFSGFETYTFRKFLWLHWVWYSEVGWVEDARIVHIYLSREKAWAKCVELQLLGVKTYWHE